MVTLGKSFLVSSLELGVGGDRTNKQTKPLTTKTQRCPRSKIKCFEATWEEISKPKIMFISIFIFMSLFCYNNNGHLLLSFCLIPGTELRDSYIHIYISFSLVTYSPGDVIPWLKMTSYKNGLRKKYTIMCHVNDYRIRYYRYISMILMIFQKNIAIPYT